MSTTHEGLKNRVLKNARKRMRDLGITNVDLGKMLGVTRQAISQRLRLWRMDDDKIDWLSTALVIDRNELLKDHKGGSPKGPKLPPLWKVPVSNALKRGAPYPDHKSLVEKIEQYCGELIE